ncbi:620_t:CDS:1, partial [Funneliformis geosporum]
NKNNENHKTLNSKSNKNKEYNSLLPFKPNETSLPLLPQLKYAVSQNLYQFNQSFFLSIQNTRVLTINSILLPSAQQKD